MSSQYFLIYSVNYKSIKIKLDLSNYATKTDLKNLNADTSTFALKANLADLKTRFDGIDANKINDIDALQGKNLVEDSYLFLEPEHRYFELSGIHMNDALFWRSTVLSDEKIKPTKDSYSPKLSFKGEKISLNFNSSILVQEKISYTHGSIVNIYVVYSLSNIVISTDSNSIAECLFGATSLSNNKYTSYSISFSSKIYPHKGYGKKFLKFNNFWCRFKQF